MQKIPGVRHTRPDTGDLHLLIASAKGFKDLGVGIKLQGVLNRQKCSGVVPAVGHPFLLGCHNRVLQTARLMGVVDPGVNDPAVAHFPNGIGYIAAVVFTPVGHGEGGEHIG